MSPYRPLYVEVETDLLRRDRLLREFHAIRHLRMIDMFIDRNALVEEIDPIVRELLELGLTYHWSGGFVGGPVSSPDFWMSYDPLPFSIETACR